MALRFEFVLVLAIVYGTSYSLKFLERYEVPILAVEILAGVIFGSVLGIVSESTPGYEFLLSVAAFGLLLIMFEAGLELDLDLVWEKPWTIGVLGVATFTFPFATGFGLGRWLGLSVFAAFLVGVTVSTTSLGLVYPLLSNFGYIETARGQLILGVAVLNDLLSVVALAYGLTLTSADPITGSVIVTATILLFFVVVPVFLVDHLRGLIPDSVLATPAKFGVFLAVVLALVMEQLGLHAVLGGFLGGLLLAELTDEGYEIERAIKPVLELITPVFFFFVGMQFRISGVGPADLWLVVLVVVLGIGTKVAGSVLGSVVAGVDRRTMLLLAAVMPGRLAISVAAAEIGLARDLIVPIVYDAFIILSIVSVFVASLAFRWLAVDEEPDVRGEQLLESSH